MSPTPYPVLFLGFTFDGEPEVGTGIQWCWTGIDGWHGVAVRGTNLSPEGYAGEVPVGHTLGARPLLFTGFVGVPDGPAWWDAANRLEEAVQAIIGAEAEFVVLEPSPKAIDARLAVGSRLTIGRFGELRPIGPNLHPVAGFTFSIPLTCPDPLKRAYVP